MAVKYDEIGTGYNSTRQADPYLTERLLYHLQPKTDRLYLDIGCGTGNYTCTLADKGLNFILTAKRQLKVEGENEQK